MKFHRLPLAAALFLFLAALPRTAACYDDTTWVNTPGQVQFIDNTGKLKTVAFESWASRKPRFVINPFAENDARKAGTFACQHNGASLVLHVNDIARAELNGDGAPVLLTMRDGKKLEVMVNTSFVWAIARMNVFLCLDGPVKAGGVPYEILSPTIRFISFE